jgi:hypothetical protein
MRSTLTTGVLPTKLANVILPFFYSRCGFLGESELVMKRVTILTLMLLLSVCCVTAVCASHLDGNIALASLGATASDNGFFGDYGIPRNAACTIDDDTVSYWAGLDSVSPQQMWILFDREYEIGEIWIDEADHAYFTAAIVEYHRGGEWLPLLDCLKFSADYYVDFEAVIADGVRISIYGVVCPGSWYNHAACLKSVEVAESHTSVGTSTISEIKALY